MPNREAPHRATADGLAAVDRRRLVAHRRSVALPPAAQSRPGRRALVALKASERRDHVRREGVADDARAAVGELDAPARRLVTQDGEDYARAAMRAYPGPWS
jgi:hypothetical protein